MKTYRERYAELESKAIAEGRAQWNDGDNPWDCGIGYYTPFFTEEERKELKAIAKVEREADEKARAEKKAIEKAKKEAKEKSKAEEMNMTLEEYREYKKIQNTKKRYANEIKKLEKEIERLQKQIARKKEYIEKK